MDCSMQGFPVLHYLLEFAKIHVHSVVMLSNHLILCRLLFFLPSVFTSIRVFSSELALRIRWPKHWSFSFSISLSNEYSELISFRIDWCDLLATQKTLKSLHQHHNLKASALPHLDLKYLGRYILYCMYVSTVFTHKKVRGLYTLFFTSVLWRILETVKVKSLSRVRLFATPWTVAYQAPPSMGFSRQEYWSGLPFPSINSSPQSPFFCSSNLW